MGLASDMERVFARHWGEAGSCVGSEGVMEPPEVCNLDRGWIQPKRGGHHFLVIGPLILPGMLTGAIFAFITSVYNVTISFFPMSARIGTLPVRTYNHRDQPIYPWLIDICSLIILWSAVLIALIERAISLEGLLTGKDHR